MEGRPEDERTLQQRLINAQLAYEHRPTSAAALLVEQLKAAVMALRARLQGQNGHNR